MEEKDFDLKKLAPLVSSDLFKFVNDEVKTIIEKICASYNLNYNEVIEKYNIDLLNIGAKFGVKKRNRRVLPANKQCMGRKLDGKQCTRGRKDGTEFCPIALSFRSEFKAAPPKQVLDKLRKLRRVSNCFLCSIGFMDLISCYCSIQI